MVVQPSVNQIGGGGFPLGKENQHPVNQEGSKSGVADAKQDAKQDATQLQKQMQHQLHKQL